MIKDGFVLRKMPGMNLVMPIGANVKDFNGALMLNDTGAFIFEKLAGGQSVDEVAENLTKEYDVTLDRAKASVDNTIKQLAEAGVIGE